MPRRTTSCLIAVLAMGFGILVPAANAAAKGCSKSSCADTTPPTVAISNPQPGAVVSGNLTVSGTAADNVAVAAIAVSVDGAAWQPAAGSSTWSWVWNTSAVTNGTHTLAARATDKSGNTRAVTETISVSIDRAAPTVAISSPAPGASVSGTVSLTGSSGDDVAVSRVNVSIDGGSWQPASGTTSWSFAWNTSAMQNGTHTLTAQANDASGKSTTVSESVTVANAGATSPPPPPPPSTAAPVTQGSWVSPEGVKISVASAGSWTIAQIYSMLQANGLDLGLIGPHLTINVQDQYATQSSVNATLYGGRYSGYTATIWLDGVNSAFSLRPDEALSHEYGYAWAAYWLYTAHNGSWAGYEAARWTTSDGSLTLATDSRTGSSYAWQIGEIVADDYRLLIGSASAISEKPWHMNADIVDPRNVPGLRDFLAMSWRTP